jgi:Nuclease-related domain
MPITPSRWRKVSESEYPWEREALEFLAEQLPGQDPVRMWSNFEFISNDGHINEVDALILTGKGLFLVEIKSRPARRLTGDAYTWSCKDGSRTVESDNVVIPTDRKTKRLASLLAPLERREGVKLPFIESLVSCSAPALRLRRRRTSPCACFGRDRASAEV